MSPTYYIGITNDNGADLEFGVFNIEIDICEDTTEVKKLFKLLTARRSKEHTLLQTRSKKLRQIVEETG